ncbi:MAG TPA: hypothetical protein VGO87_07170 [Acidimicrobiia bacterium]|jgi:hypothetical protein
MATTFLQTLRDETLRIEVGAPVVSDLAVENLDLSTPDLSQAVRQSVIERRVTEPVVRMPGPNHLAMHDVDLPALPVPCAA